MLRRRWSLLFPVVLIVGLLGLVVSCSDDEVVHISELENGATVSLDDGNIVEVSLQANPTTGFSWSITTIDQSILKETGNSTYEANSDGLGSGGIETFHFETVSSGTTTLEMAYTQVGATEPGSTFTVTLNIR